MTPSTNAVDFIKKIKKKNWINNFVTATVTMAEKKDNGRTRRKGKCFNEKIIKRKIEPEREREREKKYMHSRIQHKKWNRMEKKCETAGASLRGELTGF